MKPIKMFIIATLLLLLLPGLASATLVAEWLFEGNGQDTSGNGHNLSFTGSYSYGAGENGDQALALNGGYAFTNATTDLDLLGPDFTIEYKVKMPVQGNYGLIGTGHYQNKGWSSGVVSGNLWFMAEQGSEAAREGVYNPVNLGDNQWHHIAVVKSGNGANNVSLYLDSILLATSTFASPIEDSGYDLRIGRWGGAWNAGEYPYYGSIDDIRIYSDALTADQFGGAIPEPSSLALILFAGLALRFTRK